MIRLHRSLKNICSGFVKQRRGSQMASESKEPDESSSAGIDLELSFCPGGDVSLGHSGGFEVEAITACPHVAFATALDESMLQGPSACSVCENTDEVWACLTCGYHGCSRFVEGHAGSHHDDSSHPIAVSLADMSAWCYLCRCVSVALHS